MAKVIAVLGATGTQGGGLCRAILADKSGGFSCRAITRDPSKDKAKELATAGAGDLTTGRGTSVYSARHPTRHRRRCAATGDSEQGDERGALHFILTRGSGS